MQEKRKSLLWQRFRDEQSRTCIRPQDSKRETSKMHMPFDYFEFSPEKNIKKTVILLHGYLQHGGVFFDQWLSSIGRENIDYRIISINAPFPIVTKKEDQSFRVGFSWYFYDSQNKEFLITHDSATSFIEEGLKKIISPDSPLTIIGYSQGGYLAPFVAQQINAVDQVIGINAHFRAEYLQMRPLNFQLDAIHGDNDEVVSCEDSMRSHQALMTKASGQFVRLEGKGHQMDQGLIFKAHQLIKDS